MLVPEAILSEQLYPTGVVVTAADQLEPCKIGLLVQLEVPEFPLVVTELTVTPIFTLPAPPVGAPFKVEVPPMVKLGVLVQVTLPI